MPRTKKHYKEKCPPVKVLREDKPGYTLTYSREFDYCRNRNRPTHYRVCKFLCKRELRSYKAINIYQVKWHPKVIIYLTDSELDGVTTSSKIVVGGGSEGAITFTGVLGMANANTMANPPNTAPATK